MGLVAMVDGDHYLRRIGRDRGEGRDRQTMILFTGPDRYDRYSGWEMSKAVLIRIGTNGHDYLAKNSRPWQPFGMLDLSPLIITNP
jgi:hypothetical protein